MPGICYWSLSYLQHDTPPGKLAELQKVKRVGEDLALRSKMFQRSIATVKRLFSWTPPDRIT